jgi:choline monooxygenase
MFIHDSKLSHLLRPDQYYSEEQYRAELRHVFEPAWHLVASMRDLAKPGDFVSLELLGRPLLIRNMDGELRAFLNVCPHRHSLLTSKPRGWSERLRCQFHGWEYNAEGRTGRIPDAQSFRPFDRENSCLQRFRVDTCGPLVYVSFDPDGPTLTEFLGPLFEPWRSSFEQPYRLAKSVARDFACNWKVAVEIGLETYHSPCVHPKTFGPYPDAENCIHVLEEGYSTFSQRIKGDSTRFERAANGLIRWLGGPVRGTYSQHIVHPHLMWAEVDVGSLASCIVPLSPTTCRIHAFVFTLRGRRGGLIAPVLTKLLRGVMLFAGQKIASEDASMYPIVQRGLTSSPHPGVISMREERVFEFQKYISRRCDGAEVKSREVGERSRVP